MTDFREETAPRIKGVPFILKPFIEILLSTRVEGVEVAPSNPTITSESPVGPFPLKRVG